MSKRANAAIQTSGTCRKRKNQTIIIAFIVIGLVGLICLGGWLIFKLTRKDIESKPILDTTEAAQNAVTSFLNAYRSKEEDAGKHLAFNTAADTPISYEGFQGLLAERIDFAITSVEIGETETVVRTEIENVDLKQAFKAVVERLPRDSQQEDILKALAQEIEKDDYAKRTFESEIILINQDGYKIVMNDSLSNALLGGYNEYLFELTNGQEGLTDD